ncbi:hypothetical protein pb186bvf_018037 [Paramecium bursaria]
MSQRKFLEDDENINGDGQPKRYAASTEVRRLSEKQNNQSSSKELFEMLGIIGITYISIIIVWIICELLNYSDSFYNIIYCFCDIYSIVLEKWIKEKRGVNVVIDLEQNERIRIMIYILFICEQKYIIDISQYL